MAMPEPDRGEVWIVDFGGKIKVRPCLVLSVPVNDVERNLVTFVPRTTSDRPDLGACVRLLIPAKVKGQRTKAKIIHKNPLQTTTTNDQALD